MPENDKKRSTLFGEKEFPVIGPELSVGDEAPNFSVVDSTLQAVDLASTGKGVRVFSVVPSLDTPVCDAQTKRFEDAAGKMSDVKFYSVSMDLPYAQQRWCGTFGVDKIGMLSDHRTGSFGEQYGTLIPALRIESRAIFVIDSKNKISYVEYVSKVGDHPDYDAAMSAIQEAVAAK